MPPNDSDSLQFDPIIFKGDSRKELLNQPHSPSPSLLQTPTLSWITTKPASPHAAASPLSIPLHIPIASRLSDSLFLLRSFVMVILFIAFILITLLPSIILANLYNIIKHSPPESNTPPPPSSFESKISHVLLPSFSRMLIWTPIWRNNPSIERLARILRKDDFGLTVNRLPPPLPSADNSEKYEVKPRLKPQPHFCLTIDDAPGDHPEEVHKILNLLSKHSVKATFFVTTCTIDTPKCHAVMERIVGDGHDVGNHLSEDKRYDMLSFDDVLREVDSAEEILGRFDLRYSSSSTSTPLAAESASTMQKKYKLFRPPMGLLSPPMISALKRRGYVPPIIGDVYTNDPFIGAGVFSHNEEGELKGGRLEVDYHVKEAVRLILKHRYREDEKRSGSGGGAILIFHSPMKNGERGQAYDILEGILERLCGEWRGVTLSEGMRISWGEEVQDTTTDNGNDCSTLIISKGGERGTNL